VLSHYAYVPFGSDLAHM